MEIQIFNRNFEKNNIKIIKNDILTSYCPHCGTTLSHIHEDKVEKKLIYRLWPELKLENKYVYLDGDYLNITEENIPYSFKQLDPHFMQGTCEKCQENYASAFISIAENEQDVDSFVCDDNVTEYERMDTYMIYSNNSPVGYLIIYVDGVLNGVQDTYHELIFGPFKTPDLQGECGVSIHFENEQQIDFHENLKEASEKLINSYYLHNRTKE